MQDIFNFVGSAFENRYRIDAVIGEGGFGVVYRGFHLRLDHPIAIKCLKIPMHFTAQARELFLQRFREEGRILIKLGDAPGVPRVYDCGIMNQPGGVQVPYLVMEWLDGYSLESMLAHRKTQNQSGLRPEDAIRFLLPAVDALAVAHESQIAHRDIKPANLFIVNGPRGPTMKVLDFGIAKAMQEGESLTRQATATSTNFRAFTPNYAAPEQFAPKRYGASGPWTDVHALGMVLVEILTDRAANPGDDFVECLEHATSERRPTPRGFGARVSDQLENVVQRAVARQPEHRFSNAGAFAMALRQCPEANASGPGFAPMEPPPQTQRAHPVSALVGHRPTGTVAGEIAFVPPTAADGPPPPIHMTAHAVVTPYGLATANSPGVPTGQPVTISNDRISVPNVPQPPTGGRAKVKKGGSALPWVLGAVVLLGAGGGGAYVLTRPSKKVGKPKTKTPVSASASGDPETAPPATPPKTIFAFDYVIQREIRPLAASTEENVKGRNHARLYEENGKIVKVERVNPAGVVTLTTTYDRKPDGSIERKLTNGRGKVVDVYTVSKDGVETHIDRTGSSLMSGCARVQLKFNDAGDVTDRICQDGDGHVIIDNRGCQVTHYEVAATHLATKSRCEQEDGRPQTDSTGVHERRYINNEQGQLTEQSFYGLGGESVADTNGCQRRRYTLDPQLNRTQETCIGSTGFPVNFAGTAVATIADQFDPNGCIVKEYYLDVSNNPASIGTYSGHIYTRDKFCAEVSIASVGPAGALIAVRGGASKIERKVDDNGDTIEARCFDEKMAPMNCNGDSAVGQEGSFIQFARDDRERIVSEKNFDQTGKPTRGMSGYPHETRNTYDGNAMLAEVRYFEPDGRPASALGNISRRTYKHDPLGAETSVASFGTANEPVMDITGKHEIRRTYDAKHRLVSVELRDASGGYPATTNIKFGAVVWPPNAVRLSIVREGTKVYNKFYDAKEKELAVVDCADPDKSCER